jgi:phage nucleotide-binding protein
MNIYNASQIGDKNVTALIYAPPGMGKTTALKYLPGKTLVLDIDRTSQVLKGCNNIDIAEIDNLNIWAEWADTVIELTEKFKGKYDNVCVDNISELERCMLSDLGKKGKNNGVPSQGNYQEMQFRIVNSLRHLKTMNCNIVLTAWEMTDLFTTAEGQQYNRSYPQLNVKIMNNIMGLCDIVGKLAVGTDGKRGFFLTATNSIFAKNQVDERKGCSQDSLILKGDENIG